MLTQDQIAAVVKLAFAMTADRDYRFELTFHRCGTTSIRFERGGKAATEIVDRCDIQEYPQEAIEHAVGKITAAFEQVEKR